MSQHLQKAFTLVAIAGLFWPSLRVSAQLPEPESTFDCGTISPSPSGNSMTYNDLGRGFRFEFPASWTGRQNGLFKLPDYPCPERFICRSVIGIHALLATSDPGIFLYGDSAKVTGTETINGQQWKAFAPPGGGLGYYAFHDGLAVELVTGGTGERGTGESVPSASVHVDLAQVLSTFSFLNDALRVDRQLAALKAGQKLGSLTIKQILPGTSGFNGFSAKVKFSGRLTLSGTVMFESSMRSNSGYYLLYSNSQSLPQIPQLSCPVQDTKDLPPIRVTFTNQKLAEEQFGEHAWYEAKATVVVDNVSGTFYGLGARPSMTARLIAVTEKPVPVDEQDALPPFLTGHGSGK